MPVDTFPGAVGGFRIMKLRPNGVGAPSMLSIGKQLQAGGQRSDFEWKAKERNVMVCGKQNEHRGQRPPVWGCRCGFWFYKKFHDLDRLITPSTYGIDEGVWCLVAGWGKVVEHEIGVRTEYARPLALLKTRPPHSSPTLNDERWLKWIGKIGLPVIGSEEIGVTAMMYEVEMLDYARPSPIEQWITPTGSVVFVELAEDGHTVKQPLPEGSQRLRDGWTAHHNGIHKCKVRMTNELTYDLELQRYFDERGEDLFLWSAKNVDMATMMHNQAQIERRLRSPQAAIYQA